MLLCAALDEAVSRPRGVHRAVGREHAPRGGCIGRPGAARSSSRCSTASAPMPTVTSSSWSCNTTAWPLDSRQVPALDRGHSVSEVQTAFIPQDQGLPGCRACRLSRHWRGRIGSAKSLTRYVPWWIVRGDPPWRCARLHLLVHALLDRYASPVRSSGEERFGGIHGSGWRHHHRGVRAYATTLFSRDINNQM